ncbi:MAG: hypothetical protein WKF90_11885 [Pyrinomonadaceae bacterium]
MNFVKGYRNPEWFGRTRKNQIFDSELDAENNSCFGVIPGVFAQRLNQFYQAFAQNFVRTAALGEPSAWADISDFI